MDNEGEINSSKKGNDKLSKAMKNRIFLWPQRSEQLKQCFFQEKYTAVKAGHWESARERRQIPSDYGFGAGY